MRDDGCYVEVYEYKENSQSDVDTTYSFSLPVAGRFYGTQVKGLYTRPLPGNIQNTLQMFLSCMGCMREREREREREWEWETIHVYSKIRVNITKCLFVRICPKLCFLQFFDTFSFRQRFPTKQCKLPYLDFWQESSEMIWIIHTFSIHEFSSFCLGVFGHLPLETITT